MKKLKTIAISLVLFMFFALIACSPPPPVSIYTAYRADRIEFDINEDVGILFYYGSILDRDKFFGCNGSGTSAQWQPSHMVPEGGRGEVVIFISTYNSWDFPNDALIDFSSPNNHLIRRIGLEEFFTDAFGLRYRRSLLGFTRSRLLGFNHSEKVLIPGSLFTNGDGRNINFIILTEILNATSDGGAGFRTLAELRIGYIIFDETIILTAIEVEGHFSGPDRHAW